MVGGGTPIGVAGLAAAAHPLRQLRVWAGIGMGGFAQQTLGVGAGWVVDRASAWTLGMSYSRSSSWAEGFFESYETTWSDASWLSADISFTVRPWRARSIRSGGGFRRSGGQFRLLLSISRMVAASGCTGAVGGAPTPAPCGRSVYRDLVPGLGVAWGYYL